MKNKYALLALLIVTATIWACNKEDTDNDPATPPATTPDNAVFDALIEDNIADAEQTFTVNNEWGSQVIAEQGTRLQFEPGAFLHADGTPVSGQVNVNVVEVLSIGDMIWLNKQTVGNDNGTLKLLRSGGAVNITASQGAELLQVIEGGLTIQIPTIVGDPNMQFFTGSPDANSAMIWVPNDTTSVTVVPDYIDLYYTFSFPLAPDSLNWMNCDYFGGWPNTTTITATIPAGQSTDSTLVWIGFPSENAVMQMYHSTGQTYGTWQVAPEGIQAVLVGLRQGPGGTYYSSFTTVTVTESMNVPMTFAPTTLPQFEAALDQL